MKIIHDENRCIGCKACVIACADIHNLPSGKFMMEIYDVEEVTDDVLHTKYVMKKCNTCKDKVCKDACMYGCICFE